MGGREIEIEVPVGETSNSFDYSQLKELLEISCEQIKSMNQ